MLDFNIKPKTFKFFLSDRSKCFLSSKLFLICFSLSLSLISSLKVFNINFTALHSDESLFLDILFNRDNIIYENISNILRYKFFAFFTSLYLIFFKEPFIISVAHKFLMSFFFYFCIKGFNYKKFWTDKVFYNFFKF